MDADWSIVFTALRRLVHSGFGRRRHRVPALARRSRSPSRRFVSTRRQAAAAATLHPSPSPLASLAAGAPRAPRAPERCAEVVAVPQRALPVAAAAQRQARAASHEQMFWSRCGGPPGRRAARSQPVELEPPNGEDAPRLSRSAQCAQRAACAHVAPDSPRRRQPAGPTCPSRHRGRTGLLSSAISDSVCRQGYPSLVPLCDSVAARPLDYPSRRRSRLPPRTRQRCKYPRSTSVTTSASDTSIVKALGVCVQQECIYFRPAKKAVFPALSNRGPNVDTPFWPHASSIIKARGTPRRP